MRILFLCTSNSARSQIAEGILRHVGGDEVEVLSAGTLPMGVHSAAVRVMAELGIDISAQQSKSIDQFLDQPFDYVITLCDEADEICPVFPGGRQRLHWSIADPVVVKEKEDERLNAFRKVRDEVFARVCSFLALNISDRDSA
ncbi:MAG: arsenate reductase ArsC [Acidobacteriia bacterium]|nr:arsenate reductase ArsC [Terriglobia bacterium]